MPLLSDILAFVDSRKRVAQRNLSDLISNPRAALEKTLYNAAQTIPEYMNDPLNFVGGGLGKIAWHGSPHKFDKFSLDKIGTGEGAQAYGHGMYLAENKDVAAQYADALGSANQDVVNNAINRVVHFSNKDTTKIRDALSLEGFNAGNITPELETTLAKIIQNTDADGTVSDAALRYYRDLESLVPASKQLYKTDIPDEAVARFLDWDKSLADQPEAMNAVKSVREFLGMGNDYWNPGKLATGRNEYQKMADKAEAYNVSELLRQRGIPGIRYLDGGSRGAGQGSSNFVIFDPDMIRILERNGEQTGLKPWAPGEWGK